MIDNILHFIELALLGGFSAAAWHSLFRGTKILDYLRSTGESLSNREEDRVDKLLSSGKRYYDISIVVALVLVGLSTLDTIPDIKFAFAGLSFPLPQTPIAIHLLVILLIIASERYLLMAMPWLSLDTRRPPHAWVMMGLKMDSRYHIGWWLSLPIWISSIALSLFLARETDSQFINSIFLLAILSNGSVNSVRAIYYWHYFIRERLDHRGGRSTLSMHLLYRYRLARQIVLGLFLAYPLIFLVPEWRLIEYQQFLESITPYIAIGVAIRYIGLIKPVYRLIDKIGKKHNFPIESPHYD